MPRGENLNKYNFCARQEPSCKGLKKGLRGYHACAKVKRCGKQIPSAAEIEEFNNYLPVENLIEMPMNISGPFEAVLLEPPMGKILRPIQESFIEIEKPITVGKERRKILKKKLNEIKRNELWKMYKNELSKIKKKPSKIYQDYKKKQLVNLLLKYMV